MAKLDIQSPIQRAEAARLLRHVRIMWDHTTEGPRILPVRAWRNRAAIEAANRHFGCLRKARRCTKPASIFQAEATARMWDRVGMALERGWQTGSV